MILYLLYIYFYMDIDRKDIKLMNPNKVEIYKHTDYSYDIFNNIIGHYIGIEYPSKYGDLDLLKNILNSKPFISDNDTKAIQLAALYGHNECLELLLNYGYKSDIWTFRNAARNCHYNCLQILLKYNMSTTPETWPIVSFEVIVNYDSNINNSYKCLELLLSHKKQIGFDTIKYIYNHQYQNCIDLLKSFDII